MASRERPGVSTVASTLSISASSDGICHPSAFTFETILFIVLPDIRIRWAAARAARGRTSEDIDGSVLQMLLQISDGNLHRFTYKLVTKTLH